MSPTTTMLTDEGARFVAERHLATLSTLSPDGSIHVTAIGFTLHDGVVRIITTDGRQKIRNIERNGHATVAQVEGRHWISFAGRAVIERDPADVAHAVELYSARYRAPQPNPERVVIRFDVDRVLASSGLRAD
ncbi:PPOX class probable F420-dependent enzyme [Conyzicola lurida]|uniref:PPOX class probable F420-dependent enzyme n=1 Tax=Conyzicola lurida TaxID=1172621 RepID=A0A841ALN7_9MICO|nr:PPOX class F420-dependent oxidoreductase [Conyzicola lurida]MBB5842626.1 PPOX class probable F420-dependent enzyme [Conyzicola lurida]